LLPVFQEIPNSRQTVVMLSPSSSRPTKLSRSSIRLHSFHGIWEPSQNAAICSRCAQYPL
jgi:hypothetical protein